MNRHRISAHQLRRRGLRAVVVAAALVVGAPAADAAHNDDMHSSNARLISELDVGGPQSDIAFWGDRAIVGFEGDAREPADDGFRVVDISNPEKPRLQGAFNCASSHWDLSVWEDIVVVSVNSRLDGTHCDPAANPGDDFAGLRIVSIANPKRPVQLATIPLCVDGDVPGSHNNTVVPDIARDRLIVYSSGLCPAVVEVPLRNPASSRFVRYLDAAPDKGCHDITVHVARRLAWCGITVSQLWSLEDLENPRQVAVIANPLLTNHHSVVFSSDGNTIAITEERVLNILPVCFGGTMEPEGALWFYDVTEPERPVLTSYHQLEQRGINGYCTAHQANLVPLPGERDVLSIGWNRGGFELIDFTDASDPEVLAHYIAAPDDPERFSNAWSAFWYRGHVYMTNSWVHDPPYRDIHSHRGLDVLRIQDPALDRALDLPHMNAQTQEPLPDESRSGNATRSEPAPPASSAEPRCSRRRFRLRGLTQGRVVRAALYDGRRRVRALRTPGRRAVLVDLRALRPGRYTVRAVVRSPSGLRRVVTRRYHVC